MAHGYLYNSNGEAVAKLNNISCIEYDHDNDHDNDNKHYDFINNTEFSFTINAKCNDNILYQLGCIHFYHWWRGDKADYKFTYN